MTDKRARMLYELSTIAIAMYCSFYRNLYLEETKSISRSRHTILAKRKEIYQHAKVIYAMGQLDARLSRTCVPLVFI